MAKNNKIPKWKNRIMQNGHFDKAKSDKVKDLEYLGFIAKRHHTVMYGASGTQKTTIAVIEMVKGLVENPELEIYFFSFDASSIHHRAIFEWVTEQGVEDRFIILDDSTPTELFDVIEDVTDDQSDMSNTVFIIDTLKKIVQGDINNKSGMANTMTDLKSLTTLGATILTIHHSNKDGINHSGTQEVEGDSDAVIRFDSFTDSTGTFISITQGGRIRYEFQPLSYFAPEDGTTDYSGLINKLVKLDHFVNIDSLEKEAKDFDADRDIIDAISEALRRGEASESDIKAMVSNVASAPVCKRVLKDFLNTKWRIGKDKKYQLISKINIDPDVKRICSILKSNGTMPFTKLSIKLVPETFESVKQLRKFVTRDDFDGTYWTYKQGDKGNAKVLELINE